MKSTKTGFWFRWQDLNLRPAVRLVFDGNLCDRWGGPTAPTMLRCASMLRYIGLFSRCNIFSAWGFKRPPCPFPAPPGKIKTDGTKCIFIYNTKLYIVKIYIQVIFIYKSKITINPTLISLLRFFALRRLSFRDCFQAWIIKTLPFIPVGLVDVWHIYTPLPVRRRPFSATLPPLIGGDPIRTGKYMTHHQIPVLVIGISVVIVIGCWCV